MWSSIVDIFCKLRKHQYESNIEDKNIDKDDKFKKSIKKLQNIVAIINTDHKKESVEYKEVLKTAISALKFKNYFDELYGQGLQIAYYHQNGDLEPFDNFYDEACEDRDN